MHVLGITGQRRSETTTQKATVAHSYTAPLFSSLIRTLSNDASDGFICDLNQCIGDTLPTVYAMLAPSQAPRCPRALNRINYVPAPPHQQCSGLGHSVGPQGSSFNVQTVSATVVCRPARRTCIIARSSSMFNKFDHSSIRVLFLAQQEAKVDGFTGLSPATIVYRQVLQAQLDTTHGSVQRSELSILSWD